MSESKTPPPLRRIAVVVRGVVQGVGFRPFVYNAARSRGLVGWVLNEADLVRIEVQGAAEEVAAFLESLKNHPPAQAKIDSLEIFDLPCQTEQPATFEIRTSTAAAAPRPTIPADLAICAECRVEIFDPAQRRYLYPFTNCTNCGPRWSIIEQLPYDRPRTSMKLFAMCDQCRAEYENPADRRFHAQPIACPTCGPHLQLLPPASRGVPAPAQKSVGNDGQLILEAAAAILAGKILALKGLGGFQLLADATSVTAVASLRERKRRPDRPFALMNRNLTDVRQYCEVSEEEARMLASHQAPIVLLRKLPTVHCPLPTDVAPGNPYLGVMLPYTPLHHLLMAAVDRPIVCTSGNISEEPMVTSLEDAFARLGRVADLFLTHDRPIVRPVDDSIVRFGPAGMQVLRRARGFAPLPVPVGNASGRTILAVGGHLKNTVALCLAGEKSEKGEGGRGKAEGIANWRLQIANYKLNKVNPEKQSIIDQRQTTNDQQTVLSPFPLPPSPLSPVIISAHIGDLDSAASVEVFRKAIDDLTQFYQVRPDVVVCDLHPDYASTRHAEALAARWNIPLLRVQHHHAHVAACMAEHKLTGPVLGFSWDGTGYGMDGTIWGGEALVCTGIANREVRVPGRVAHLRTFSLPGGDAAARQPRRSAFGLLYEIFGEKVVEYVADWFSPGELKTLLQMLRRGMNSPRTSSLGRLFDAVAAIVGLDFCGAMPTLAVGMKDPGQLTQHAHDKRGHGTGVITFEGQAAMALEFAANTNNPSFPLEKGSGARAYRLPLQPSEKGASIADWEPMIRDILADHASGVPAAQISLKFHQALAEMALEIAKTINLPQIVLSGGCFQNALLLGQTHSRLIEAGFQVFLPQQVPPGDGGIALGQIFIAGLQPAIE
jgi:hydrogenase maturation protein HypF